MLSWINLNVSFIKDKPRNMTIGIVLAKPPGYTETFFRSKIKGLQEKGFKVNLYCQENEIGFDLCPVYTRPPLSKNPALQIFHTLFTYIGLVGSLNNVRRFISFEKKEGTTLSKILKKIYLNSHMLKAEVDWLHFGFATMALERECIAEAIGAKMAVSFRGFDIDVYPLKNPGCYQLFWKKVDKVHAISEYLLNKAMHLGLPKEKPAEIIHPAVNPVMLPKFSRSRIKNDKLKLITVARLHWIKGMDILIAAAEILREKNIEFEWLIAGAGDKKEEERYRFHVYEKKLEKHVVFLGALSHAQTIQNINDADIYVQTSLSEGFCNAVLEAQALGKICIAFSVGGLPENIENEKSGLLVDSLSAEKLAIKITEVLAFPASKLSNYSEYAVRRVKDNFSTDMQSTSFQRFYE